MTGAFWIRRALFGLQDDLSPVVPSLEIAMGVDGIPKREHPVYVHVERALGNETCQLFKVCPRVVAEVLQEVRDLEAVDDDVPGVEVSGVDPAFLKGHVGADVKLIYATPSFQNPTSALMPKEERHRLAQLASAHGAVLVEDEAQAELALDAAAPPPIAAFADGASVVTIGSLSKVFWGGLRVGWIRAPQPVLSHLGRLKAILDLGSSLPSQVLAALLLQRADEIIPIRIQEIRSRSALLGSLVSARLPGWSFSQPAGGLVLWTKLPHGSASELAEVARANGTLILPGSMTSPSGWFDDHVRLPYVARPEVLEQGVRRLARAWQSYGGQDARREREVGVIG